jgi:hypothetical protein
MDPYTEYLGSGLARKEPPYWLPKPRAPRRPRSTRTNRWLRRRA